MTPKATHTLFISLTLLGASIAVLGAMWFLLAQSADAVQTSMEEQKKETRIAQEHKHLEELYTESEEARTKLRSLVIGKDGVADFLELIEETARRGGLQPTTRSVRVEPLDASTKFEALSLTLEVTGAYANVKAFLPLLESLPYQSEIRSVALDRAAENDKAGIWSGTFIMRISKEKEQ